jgi:A/G-specific adenine glycosylase
MLQQTPVVRVLPVWEEWLRRWPEPAALAGEPAGEAVRAWGRLGYPRRALRLHAAAVAIERDHGGRVPQDYAELLGLPGVGSYTAAAVAAFRLWAPRDGGGHQHPPGPRTALFRLRPARPGPDGRGDAACRGTAAVRRRNFRPAGTLRSWSWGRWYARPGHPSVLPARCATGAPGSPPASRRRRTPPRARRGTAQTAGPRRRDGGPPAGGCAGAGRDVPAGPRRLGFEAAGIGVPLAALHRLNCAPEQLERALAGLLEDGLAELHQGGYRLPA